HGYRGLCRYNKSGHFNIPYGNYKNPYFPEKEIRAFAEKAQRATFICASFDETLAMLKAGDVVYCDPPYDGTFSGYHTDGFTEDDQYHLASVLEHRSSEGHPVIVSNSDTSLIRSLGTVAKLAMRQPFVLFKGLTFQKLCLPGAFRPG
ncbi:Dam family site-specific DNA-(adenine-N6)-methyltransferase, partial [Escherichia coli]